VTEPVTITLAEGRERALLRHHPWIFRGAVGRVAGPVEPGGTVRALDANGRFLAWAAWSPDSQIAARVWTFDEAEVVDPAFFRRRVTAAVERRRSAGLLTPGGGWRLVYGENDGLPGVVVDDYAGHLVCQFSSAGAERWREAIVAALREETGCLSIYERSDGDGRAKEGLPRRVGPLAGDPPPSVAIEEHGLRFLVDVRAGHKTGWYLDQRDNRAVVRDLARSRRVLNVFSYTGAFAVAALRGGAAAVTNVEASETATAAAREHVAVNDGDPAAVEHVVGDAFEVLRAWRNGGRSFDLVVLDPPKFVTSRAALERASRGYKDINLLGCRLLAPGGLLVTFSCSGLLPADLFQKIVADAALDAGREARIIRRLSQPADHPVLMSFPEGGYLKGLVCRVE